MDTILTTINIIIINLRYDTRRHPIRKSKTLEPADNDKSGRVRGGGGVERQQVQQVRVQDKV